MHLADIMEVFKNLLVNTLTSDSHIRRLFTSQTFSSFKTFKLKVALSMFIRYLNLHVSYCAKEK